MKISVITAVRNNCTTISNALESVLTQDHPDTEVIVIDGASTDGTLEIIQRYLRHIDQMVSEPDRGIYDALNKGIRLATGEAIGFLHADDRYANHRVLSRIAASFADPRIDACYGDILYVRRDDPSRVVRHWRAGPFHPGLLARGWMPPHVAFYARRSVYLRLGGFDLGYKIAGDYDCLLRFLGAGRITCAYIPEVLIHMRMGGVSNRSLRNILEKSREDYRALRQNRVGGIGALLRKNMQKVPQFYLAALLWQGHSVRSSRTDDRPVG
jgi:glycosyltransferase